MFIDYLAMLLVNMVAGLVLLACYGARGMAAESQRGWTAGFAATGLLALVGGLHICFSWPLPGAYNVAFGEPAALFGVTFLALAWATWHGAGLMGVGIYAAIAGAGAIVVGCRIIGLQMTAQPLMSGAGFILTGLAGVLLPVAVALKSKPAVRAAFATVAILAALIWALTGYGAIWMHMKSSANWTPATMPAPEAAQR